MSEPVFNVHQYNLTGNETIDVTYLNAVGKVAEKFNGTLYYEHNPGKNLYRFEVGGVFPTQADADKFGAALSAVIDNFNAAALDAEVAIKSKKEAQDVLHRVIGEISRVGTLGKKFLTKKERHDFGAVIRDQVDKA